MISSRISPDNIYRRDLERVYSSGLDLEALSEANILVTGATGLIGTCVVDMLMCYPIGGFMSMLQDAIGSAPCSVLRAIWTIRISHS